MTLEPTAADGPRSDPARRRGSVVFVQYIALDEDYWTAVWQDGSRHRDINGTRSEVIAWALEQPADQRLVFDLDAGEYVPLPDDGLPVTPVAGLGS